MKILYKQENGRLAIVNLAEDFDVGQLGTVINNFVPTGVNYAIVDGGVLPTDHEFRDAWVIDDNLLTNSNVDSAVITLDQTTVEEIKLKRTPTITRRQFKLVLLDSGLLDDLELAISNIEDATEKKRIEIEYAEATDFARTSESVKTMFALINQTEEQINELWEKALAL